MKNIAQEIEKLLALHDPEQFVCNGAPANEYKKEAQELATLCNQTMSVDDIAIIVGDLFHRNFDISYHKNGETFIAWTRHALGKMRESIDGLSLTVNHEVEPPAERSEIVKQIATGIQTLFDNIHK